MVRIRLKPERFSEPINLQKHRKSRRLLNFNSTNQQTIVSVFRAIYFASVLEQIFTTGDALKKPVKTCKKKPRDSMLPRDLCRIERPTDTKWISGQQRQGFQQKTRTKATKQKQCISNPQNDNLMKIKIRKRYRWLQKNQTHILLKRTFSRLCSTVVNAPVLKTGDRWFESVWSLKDLQSL